MILPIAFYDHIVLSAVREVIVQTDAIPHKIDVSDVVEGHVVEDCPKGQRMIYNAIMECPICNGAHLGKDCKRKIKGSN